MICFPVTISNFKTVVQVRGFAFQATTTEFTGRFRSDSGTGNMKHIIESIIDEKFPEWGYDDNSIPDIDIDFATKNFQDVPISQILDTFAERANRSWFLDKKQEILFYRKKL